MPQAIQLSKQCAVEQLDADWRDTMQLMKRVNSTYSVYREGTWCYLIDVKRERVAVECPLSRRKRAGNTVYHPDYTKTHMRYRGQGLALLLYKTLLKLGVQLVSGDSQSVGSRKLWGKLCGTRGVTVWARSGSEWDTCARDPYTGYPDCEWDPYERNTTLFAVYG